MIGKGIAALVVAACLGLGPLALASAKVKPGAYGSSGGGTGLYTNRAGTKVTYFAWRCFHDGVSQRTGRRFGYHPTRAITISPERRFKSTWHESFNDGAFQIDVTVRGRFAARRAGVKPTVTFTYEVKGDLRCDRSTVTVKWQTAQFNNPESQTN